MLYIISTMLPLLRYASQSPMLSLRCFRAAAGYAGHFRYADAAAISMIIDADFAIFAAFLFTLLYVSRRLYYYFHYFR